MSDIKTSYHYDEMSDTLTIKREQDVEGHIDALKAMQDSVPYEEGLGYYAGSIPAVVVEEYCKTCGITFEQFINEDIHIKRIMNDPDYKKFRVWEGRI